VRAKYVLQDQERVEELIRTRTADAPAGLNQLVRSLPTGEAPGARTPGQQEKPPAHVIRGVHTKTGKVRFISHLDWMSLLEKALRRAVIPVAFSSGFNPHPKITYGPPLPVGAESLHELVDIRLVRRMSVESFLERINNQLPAGVRFTGAQVIPPNYPGFAKMIKAIVYHVHMPAAIRQRLLADGVDAWLNLTRLYNEGEPNAWRGMCETIGYDPRGAICDSTLSRQEEAEITMRIVLAHDDSRSVHPLDLMGLPCGLDRRQQRELRLVRLGFFRDRRGEQPVT
ncbi:DUF2344 domain-containing protein, partial [bacterium]|nr:DUF2344 domain-containing protein [candidate division CSSED10-310 bacterium]